MHNTNTACCTVPPAKSDYTPKGSFKAYAGFNKVSPIICDPFRIRSSA